MSAFKNINCASASNEYTDPPYMFYIEKYDDYRYFLDEKSALSGAMRVIASHLQLILPGLQRINLILSTLWPKSADNKSMIFLSNFSKKTGSDISCKSSPSETICMKCQLLFSGKNKKTISKYCLLKFYPTC